MYTLIIGNSNEEKIVPVISGSFSHSLNEAGSMSVDILGIDIAGVDITRKAVSLFYKQNLIFQGFVESEPSYRVSNNITIASLNCISNLGLLAYKEADTKAVFQNQDVRTIISYLISNDTDFLVNYRNTGGWTFTPTLTLDLRNKETLLAQIKQVVSSVPGFNMREIPYAKVIEFGFFLESDLQAERDIYFGTNLLSLDIKEDNKNITNGIYGYAGEARNQNNQATLEKASSYATVTSHPLYVDFPIVLNTKNNTYYVNNTRFNTDVKSFSSVQFEEVKAPEEEQNNSPTNLSSSDVNEASYTLWLKCVNELIESEPKKLLSGQLLTTINAPLIGDKMNIRVTVKDDLFFEKVYIIVENETYILQKLEHKIGDILYDSLGNEMFKYTYEMSDKGVPVNDSSVIYNLYKKINEKDNKTKNDGKSLKQNGSLITTTTSLDESTPADSRIKNIFGIKPSKQYNALQVTIPIPSLPTWSLGRDFEGIALEEIFTNSTNTTYYFEIVQKPSLSQPLIINITNKEFNWGLYSGVPFNLNVSWRFYEYV